MEEVMSATRLIQIAGIQNDRLCSFLERSIRYEEDSTAPDNHQRQLEIAQARMLLAVIEPND